MNEYLEKLSDDVRKIKSIIYAADELVMKLNPDSKQLSTITAVLDMLDLMNEQADKTDADIMAMKLEVKRDR